MDAISTAFSTTRTPQGIADDIVELLSLCQMLQSEKENVTRLSPTEYSREDDPFADRIRQAIGYTRQLQHLLPMAQQLCVLGIELERQGKIRVGVGEDYAKQALAYVVAQYPASGGTGQ
ncbi:MULTISPECIES: hypothetical protein [Citrobacter freundii complex]|uniref:hypothetical protein n=1 Tax=Citrobacter freundii complex TaxID=1344959 RepID=UPI000EF1C096|nr:hypothetical protein [Citrobacter freundii]AYL49951.1 hypothetical protein CUC46_23920 [Citrobacter freundii]HAT3909810.1 hypothetical protein [Citrobacter freundii]HCJ6665031.1 hypothetical protein [Citrobacter freundii]HEJ0145141.1 hypothetical protein [Citrobacter freundii]